jgi:hypothetical protein
LKAKIHTKEIKTEFTRKRELADCTSSGEPITAFYDPQFTLAWESDDKSGTFARVTVYGANGQIIADALHRYLLHKFPLTKSPESLRGS